MPVARWPQQALLLSVHAYRLLLKPWLGNACRFEPTCSQYALQALQLHGALRGGWLSGARVLRCHPWCDGGCDPVPAAPPVAAVRFDRREAPPGVEPPATSGAQACVPSVKSMSRPRNSP